MTQEELDALMADDGADAAAEPSAPAQKAGGSAIDDLVNEIALGVADELSGKVGGATTTQDSNQKMPDDFRVSADAHWPPPPPTDDHKMVRQLDDVTRDSEEKATQVLDELDVINTLLMDGEEQANSVKAILDENTELFDKLSAKFTNISAFKEQKAKCEEASANIDSIIEKLQEGQNDIMNIMDMMQYQDIHRQKIERVINVMRALSKYMSSLFESDIDDKSRVPSAVHLEGDNTENLMSDDDIEALINSFGKK